MKKFILFIFATLLSLGDLTAKVDRYKSDVDQDKTINHITYQLPFYYAKDRTNLIGSYTLATNIGNKSSGNLSFEFVENECPFSQDLRKAVSKVTKDFVNGSKAEITIGFEMANGEVFMFNSTYFKDWRMSEWNDLINVTYNSETGVYRSTIMFPLDYLTSSVKNLPSNTKMHYVYLLEVLAKTNIKRLFINDSNEEEDININIPIHRPTAETMNDMINRKNKNVKPESKRERKRKVQNGKNVR